jgi:AsmA protein
MGLEAHGTVETAPRSTRFDLAAAIDRLDADRLLLPSPPSTGPAQPAAAAGKGAASPFAGLAGRATLRVGEAVVRRQRVTDLRATVEVKGDEVTLSEGRFGAWGGTVSLAGTQVRLAPTEPPFTVVARAEGVQAAAALAAWTDRQVLSGQLDTAVRLSGQGATSEAIQRALDGTVEGTLKDGVFHGKDLVAEVAAPLVAAIPGLKGKVSRGGTTSLGKAVPFSVRIQGGQARLQKPLEVENRDATATVQGSVALDGELDMPVRLSLAPRTVSELTGGRARLQVPLPLDFTLRGKAWSPRLAGLEVGPAVRAITEAIGAQALGKVLGLGGQAPAGAEGAGQGAAETGAQDAKAKADAARRKLEEDASKALKKLLGR